MYMNINQTGLIMPRNPHQMPEIEKGHTITPTRAMKERGEAARIEKNISPIGENEEIPESQLRPLTKLEPEQQKEARHSILCLLSRWQGRIKKSETGKS